LLFEEFLVREAEAGRLKLPLGAMPAKALVHGHCHQKSFGAFKPVEKILRLIPDLSVETIESSCCGMAGAFGYGADTYQASIEMAELSLLPAVRRADAAALIVADGTSCRHQIKDGGSRSALHVARVLAMSLDSAQRTANSDQSQRN
jgi:Fe-S oxidoreductase